MRAWVVDTNVVVVANNRDTHADAACVAASAGKLREIQSGGIVVIDGGFHILNEYGRNLRFTGQPGVGHLFYRWLLKVRCDPGRCETVRLTPRGSDPEDFEEFPDDPELGEFDRADRKFVAAAIASQSRPEVLNATDTDWWEYRTPLERHGVRVQFLCPDLMR